MFRILVLVVVSYAMLSCDTSTPEFYYTQNDLKYKYHDIADGGVVPAIGDYLTVYMQYKDQNDSIFYNSLYSTYDGKELIKLGKPSIEGGIEEGFAQLQLGDSVTFFIEVDKFFKHYLNKEIPAYLDAKEEMRISLRLLNIESPLTYEKRILLEQLKAEAIELDLLEGVIQKWDIEGDSVYNKNNVFMVYEDTNCLNRVAYGDLVKVKYKGYFIDGKVFYDNTAGDDYDEFKVGVKDQTIEGMKIALVHMCYGQKAKVLVPSDLGFGASVIEQGLVPKYAPVIFEIEVLE